MARSVRTLLFILLSCTSGIAGNLVDSLEKRLPLCNDSEKVTVMTRLVTEYSTMDPDKAADYCVKAVHLAEKINNPYLQVITLISQCAVYNTQSNYDGSLELALRALRIAEQTANKDLVARCHINIGYTYQKLHDYKTSIKYCYKALSMIGSLNDKKVEGNLYNNFGNSYYELHELDSAMTYHKKALKIRLAINDKRGISYSYNNIGNVYIDQKDAGKALEYYIKSIAIKEEIGDKKGIAGGNINISGVYSDIKQYESAVQYALRGITQAAEIHAKDFLLEGYGAAANAYEGLGNHKKSNEYLRRLMGLKDSLFNENITKQIAEMQAKYESDKKEKELELQSARVNSLEAKNNEQRTLILGAVVGVILLLLTVGMVYSRYVTKQRANMQLEAANDKLQHLNEIVNKRNSEIERQSDEIRGKNKDITDSIVYARRIQSAIMPPVEDLKKEFPDSFIYYKPRDIVSGDFYWFLRTEQYFIIACADCTGHGVPGAFMSMICVQLLNLVVRDSNVTTPEHALQLLDEGVHKALRQSGSEHDATDGMDIALCAIDMKEGLLKYAGAFRPLYIVRGNELVEVSANKFSIGGHKNVEKLFNGHNIRLAKGDRVYLFTDGYADQFGGSAGKKFKMKNFKKLLLTACSKPMHEQHRIIEQTMEEWKGDLQQLDDILVMGMAI